MKKSKINHLLFINPFQNFQLSHDTHQRFSIIKVGLSIFFNLISFESKNDIVRIPLDGLNSAYFKVHVGLVLEKKVHLDCLYYLTAKTFCAFLLNFSRILISLDFSFIRDCVIHFLFVPLWSILDMK